MKRTFVSLLMLCPFALFAQTNFTIKGKVSDAASPLKKVYVNYYDGEGYPPTDSAVIKNGVFEVSGTMKDDEYNSVRLTIGHDIMKAKPGDQLYFFIKKGDAITVDVKDDARKATISGSKQSEIYQSVEDSLSQTKDVDAQLVIIKRLIEQYPDSKMSFETLDSHFNPPIAQHYADHLPEIMKMYDMLSSRLRETKRAIAYHDGLEAVSHLVIGGTLVDFTSKTADGKVIKLSDFRGKYVLVDFWASWCIPCRAEFPYLKKAYARFKNKNFEIIGYSIDNDKSLWVSAMENDDVDWLNVSNLVGTRDPIALTYNIHAVPANFLIGPDGKVIAINLRGELLEPTLEKFIK